MRNATLVPDPAVVTLEEIVADDGGVTLVARARRAHARCPLCDQVATRVHSWYTRRLADVPWQGLAVRLRLRTRRWSCDNPACARRIFAERLPTVALPHAQRTRRLATIVLVFGVAVGGAPGARLLAELGIAVSGDTLRRAVAGATLPALETPGVLGVDDWRLRRGHTYGTIFVDLERRRPVDLLPDRSAARLEVWPREHPGVAIICRDRGGAYADGAAQGAPEAVHVADRFHLLANLGDALARAVVEQRPVRPPAPPPPPPPPVSVPDTDRSAHERNRRARQARREERYQEIQRLHAQGLGYRRIAHRLGLHRATVRKYVAAPARPQPAPRHGRQRGSDPFLSSLRARWDAGERRVTVLRQELRARGYLGRYQRVAVAVAPWRDGPARRCAPRQVAWLLGRNDEALPDRQRATLTALLTDRPTLAEARTLALEFGRPVRERDGPALEAWFIAAETSEAPAIRGFAGGLRRDQAAIQAALDHEWSSGQVEGQVNRLKLVKRQAYGRAGFALLRRRYLLAS